VLDACYQLDNQENPNIAEIARKHDALYNRVYRRFTGRVFSKIDSGWANKALDEIEEQTLYMYIEFADDLGIPIYERTLTKTANSILRNHRPNANPPSTVSKMWAS
jgi:Tc5 transposase DNA-binding domain